MIRELLRRFYLKRGYADFRVISAIAELSPDKKSFVVTYVLDEGPRYEVENIVINSAIRDVDTAPLYDEILIEKGDWYNADLTEKSVLPLPKNWAKRFCLC